jgi:glycosyltransferase involved in cell wall biosynthesis
MLLPHYRVKTYGYLHTYLINHNYNLAVVTEGIQKDYNSPISFPLYRMKLSLSSLIRFALNHKPKAYLLVIAHSKRYFFPFLIFLKTIKQKFASWTHGVNLQRKHSKLSRFFHHLEHALCDGIILYGDHMKEYIAENHLHKVYIANNTINLTEYNPRLTDRAAILRKHGITTEKNIIFVGRIQKRKRIKDLFKAFELLSDKKYGLIIVGPDEEAITAQLKKNNPRVYTIGPLYGTDVLDLLKASDVFCIPGSIGLSIVDAMYCGLPVVTERLDHGPEIMYLRDGINGFFVDKGDYRALADRIQTLLENEELHLQFSQKAREEIETNGHIDNLCKGILQCLNGLTSPDSYGN